MLQPSQNVDTEGNSKPALSQSKGLLQCLKEAHKAIEECIKIEERKLDLSKGSKDEPLALVPA